MREVNESDKAIMQEWKRKFFEAERRKGVGGEETDDGARYDHRGDWREMSDVMTGENFGRDTVKLLLR